ncbi:PREDICTED: uncharacterized protein LOC109191019 [Ipomoea nil]|uniref:uncharacterized protein LOC109191019 n=1 Tax=Ipomoea nil TaxID=35883 RepID=UPI0009012609|nr:PREDICTED: uncharacterized protein LOC109191019 [Ipomoea nil]
MKVLVWNVRGVSSNGSARRTRVLLRSHLPFILCLLEPCKYDNAFTADRLESFRIKFNFDNAYGSGNRIWLFWNNDLTVSIESQMEQCVTILCAHSTVLTPFWLSFVYAKTRESLRGPLWDELKAVCPMIPGGVPWSIVGNFNCLMSVDEKKGGLPYSHRKTLDFCECVSACGLIDATYYGSCFTWWNGRRGEAAIWMRLDRCLYTSEWEAVFKTSVRHLSKATSDHSPLLITCNLLTTQVVPKHFVFLNVWVKHEAFQTVVRDGWQAPVDGASMFVLAAKLKRLDKVLSKWSRTVFGDIFAKLREYEDTVHNLEAVLQQHPEDERALIEYQKGVAMLKKQIAIEEEYRQQKARVTEVQDGDRNSRYFHAIVKERRRKLYIHRVKNGDGVWLEDRQGIAQQAVAFFERMFTAEVGGFDLARLYCIPRLVMEDDNDLLIAVPGVEEVKEVVMQMSSTSAAGPDGFSGAFYKAC